VKVRNHKKIAFMLAVGIFTGLTTGTGAPLGAQVIDVYKRPVQAEPSRDFDFLHYLIQLNINIAAKKFEGETTVTLTPLHDGLASVVLDAEEYTVTGVRAATGMPLFYEHISDKLSIRLPRPTLHGEILSFTVTYYGRDPKNGLRFYEASGDRPLLVASDSFPDNVHHWCPCWDYPHDKATHEIVATVPAGNRVAANGRLLSVREDATQKTVTYHWLQDKPHSTYLFFLAVAPYVIVEDRLGTLPINYWVYPRHADRARRTFGKTPEMMVFFSNLFDFDYPWAKYDQVEVPFGGAAESTTMTAMGESIVVDERGEIDFPSMGVVSHELAHQWWGDLVTLRTWSETWINESFATYCDFLYHRHALGEDEGAVNLLAKKNSYLQEARTRYIRPIVFDRYERPEQNFDRHTYQKGATVLHMLRSLIGDDAFFRTLSRFLHEHAFQPTDTQEFMKTVKEATGQNLDWFFDEWLYRPGHPIFDVTADWNGATKKLTWRIVQTQDTAAGIPYYRMPVVLGVRTSTGKTSEKVWISGRERIVAFDCPQKPLMVRFDVGDYLLKELTFERPVEELLYQLVHDDALGRMWAASQIGRHADDSRVAPALIQCAKSDAFWAVRRDACYILGGFESPIELDERFNIPFTRLNDGYHPGKFLNGKIAGILQERTSDPNPKVRAAAFWALGNLRDRRLISFLKERFAAEDSYGAQAAALVALGKTGDRSLVRFLQNASGMKAHGIIKQAADWALKEIK